jgi:hypothetical protein
MLLPLRATTLIPGFHPMLPLLPTCHAVPLLLPPMLRLMLLLLLTRHAESLTS